jgi:hypothetical protein
VRAHRVGFMKSKVTRPQSALSLSHDDYSLAALGRK